MSIEKRIKRHIIGPHHDFFAITLPGFEAICHRELAALSDTVRVTGQFKGGIAFSGKMADLYLANLNVRTAGRILMRLTSFQATNFRQLEKQAGDLPWELYLPPGALPDCNTTCRHSRLYHSQAVNQHMASLVGAHWKNRGLKPEAAKGQTLFIRIEKDQVTLSLDASGANLYQRGLKKHHSPAPLRETQAAGILTLAGYNPRRPLVDPMCGSGTFTLEAALMAKQIPPGRHRRFAFMDWPAFREPQWRYFKTQAAKALVPYDTPLILASDKDRMACRQLAECVARNGLDDAVTVRRLDFFDTPDQQTVPSPPGLVVLNPPYGRRLKPEGSIESFYTAIGRQLQTRFPGWNLALVVPNTRFADRLPFTTSAAPLPHGGLKLALLTGCIPA